MAYSFYCMCCAVFRNPDGCFRSCSSVRVVYHQPTVAQYTVASRTAVPALALFAISACFARYAIAVRIVAVATLNQLPLRV